MTGSRRKFLASAAALLGVSATAPFLSAESLAISTFQPRAPRWVDSAAYNFTPELFKKLIGRTFKVQNATGGSMQMVLSQVLVPVSSSNGPGITGFGLHFQQTSGNSLPQDTYETSIAELGTFPLFIVPASKARLTTYTAIINHI